MRGAIAFSEHRIDRQRDVTIGGVNFGILFDPTTDRNQTSEMFWVSQSNVVNQVAADAVAIQEDAIGIDLEFSKTVSHRLQNHCMFASRVVGGALAGPSPLNAGHDRSVSRRPSDATHVGDVRTVEQRQLTLCRLARIG